ncbi:hypothetical protein ACQ4N7_28640 [Nodosilinea sp. AN01ver1]|uniref:hypothetical protein n=1 Tax=Nodosilinea sp. AN01ver1 TaxID=3423362 RepID=UPI003D31CCA5
MFNYLEPDASDDQGNPGTGSLPLSSGAGGNDRGTRSLKPPTPEKVRHMLYGSLAAIDRTIKILHALGYADPNDWSDPIPAPPGVAMGDTAWSLRLRSATGTEATGAEPRSLSEADLPAVSGADLPAVSGVELWMVILTKTLLLG